MPCIFVLCCWVCSVRLCEGYLRLIRQRTLHAVFGPTEDDSLRRLHLSCRLQRDWRKSRHIVVLGSDRRILHHAL